MICFFLLTEVIPTNVQIIHYQQDRCNSNVDNDLLLKVRDLQLESERRLQDQLTQLKEEFAQYKNESMDNQTALKEELKRQGKELKK